jgi:hypothetical protein
MISIIISSVSADLLADLSENIRRTIGVPYEILSFSNAEGEHSICNIYNKGIAAAKYDILCFVHEDVKIHTENWGGVVLDTFNKYEKVGLIGVAGGRYKTLFPCSWHMGSVESDRYRIVQHFKYREGDIVLDLNNPNDDKLCNVATVDGVWFCVRKTALDGGIKFDEVLLKGFHGYDVDFSLSIGQFWDVSVTFEVLIEHFSEGNYDANWMNASRLVHEKWHKTLPKSMIHDLRISDQIKYECQAFYRFIDSMVSVGFGKKKMYGTLLNSKIYKIIGWKKYLKMYLHIRSLNIK